MQQGDTVTVTAYGLYQQPVQHGFFFSLASWLTSLLQPAQAPPASMDGRTRRDLPLLQVGVAAGLTSLPQLSGGVPQGYVRLLMFNRDSALVGQQVQQLTQLAQNSYESLSLRVIAPQDGYVSAYVGNGSEVDVLFDDVNVEHRPGLQVQEVHYDPAGLELAGLSPASPGIKGLNHYRFNGKEFQPDLGLAWNHQDWRFFDPQLLRWHAVDPELENGQESWTPYAFGYDNAIRYADANGRAPGPGDLFKTQDEAAKDFGKTYNGPSIRTNKEYLTIFYKTGEPGREKYSYVPPQVGGTYGVVSELEVPKGTEMTAVGHTHGAYLAKSDNYSSTPDRELANAMQPNLPPGSEAKMYSAVPQGSLKVYNATTKQETTISKDLPSDPHDSSRVNNINPSGLTAPISNGVNLERGPALPRENLKSAP